MRNIRRINESTEDEFMTAMHDIFLDIKDMKEYYYIFHKYENDMSRFYIEVGKSGYKGLCSYGEIKHAILHFISYAKEEGYDLISVALETDYKFKDKNKIKSLPKGNELEFMENYLDEPVIEYVKLYFRHK